MTEKSRRRGTFARVDLDAVLSNYGYLRGLAGGAKVCPVVKADAYGHGALPVAGALEERGGCTLFAVGNLGEALALREGGIRAEILILFGSEPGTARILAEKNLTAVVGSLKKLAEFSETAEKEGLGLGVHLKFDTGMARLGLDVGDAGEAASIIKKSPRLSLKGVSTHFAKAGDDRSFTEGQLRKFEAAIKVIEDAGVERGMVHAANSAALLTDAAARFDCVRTGIALYGIRPEKWLDPEGRLKPALEWVSEILQLRKLGSGIPVSYGGTFVTGRPSVIATIPVGYADGYRRSLGGVGQVIIGGKRCPVVGRVCMDLIMADVTDVPTAEEGGEVVLIGKRGDSAVTAEEMAGWQSTIPYEVLCAISARVPRIYR